MLCLLCSLVLSASKKPLGAVRFWRLFWGMRWLSLEGSALCRGGLKKGSSSCIVICCSWDDKRLSNQATQVPSNVDESKHQKIGWRRLNRADPWSPAAPATQMFLRVETLPERHIQRQSQHVAALQETEIASNGEMTTMRG